MNSQSANRFRKTLTITTAGALVLGLAACDRQTSPEKMSQDIDRGVDKTGEQISQMTENTEQKIAEAKSAPSKKTAKTGENLADAAITAKVKSALIAEPGLHSTGIDVVTEKGVVSLFGTTVSDANRDKATRLAAAVDGVKAVENNLAIVQGS